MFEDFIFTLLTIDTDFVLLALNHFNFKSDRVWISMPF